MTEPRERSPQDASEIGAVEARWLAKAHAAVALVLTSPVPPGPGVVIGEPRLMGVFPETVVAIRCETRKVPAGDMKLRIWDAEVSAAEKRPVEASTYDLDDLWITLEELSSIAMNGCG